jgi:hypothetical protein
MATQTETHSPTPVVEPKSYAVAIRTRADKTKWVYNQLRFAEKLDAMHYGAALKRRWPDCLEFEIQPTGDPPNATYPVPSDRYATADRLPHGHA